MNKKLIFGFIIVIIVGVAVGYQLFYRTEPAVQMPVPSPLQTPQPSFPPFPLQQLQEGEWSLFGLQIEQLVAENRVFTARERLQFIEARLEPMMRDAEAMVNILERKSPISMLAPFVPAGTRSTFDELRDFVDKARGAYKEGETAKAASHMGDFANRAFGIFLLYNNNSEESIRAFTEKYTRFPVAKRDEAITAISSAWDMLKQYFVDVSLSPDQEKELEQPKQLMISSVVAYQRGEYVSAFQMAQEVRGIAECLFGSCR